MSKSLSGFVVIGAASAAILLPRLKFLSEVKAAGETFSTAKERQVTAEKWAEEARTLKLALALGYLIELDWLNVVLLVEALEGSQAVRKAPIEALYGVIRLAQSLAQRLEPHIGRAVIPDFLPMPGNAVEARA